MRITLLLFLHPVLNVAYNFEEWNRHRDQIYALPTSYVDYSNAQSRSYFGYSVLLYSHKSSSSSGSPVQESWILVGAPKARIPIDGNHVNNKIPIEPGVAFRCPIGPTMRFCEPLNFTNPDDEIGFIDQVQENILIEKQHGWVGAAMSVQESTGSLTVCAPRTIVRINSQSEPGYQTTMHGICYKGDVSTGNLHTDDKNLSTYNFDSQFWYNPTNGFAVHYTTPKATRDSIRPVIGSPKHEFYGSVRKMGQHKAAELPIGDNTSHFGYALTSGYYFHKQQLVVAAGAPGWHYVGQVAIMDPRTEPLSIVRLINGEEVGEYFGASLATGDMNNDGLDDLIVGAPHWKNDNGRVLIFLGNKNGFFSPNVVLEGSVDDALYGYAVTSGDIDGDGAYDLIVGAPWEDDGVVYVYNGDTKLDKLNSLKPSQRIGADGNRGFGFALSKPVDIDGNGFPDVAVGAYASDRAMLLLSMPAIKTAMTLSTSPKTLSRNSTHFTITVCIKRQHSPRDTNRDWRWASFICLKVDREYQRVVANRGCDVYFRNSTGWCTSQTWQLKTNNRNYVDAIEITATHVYLRPVEIFSTPYAIEYKARNATSHMKLPFDIGCGLDNICHTSVYAKLFFQGIRNSTWIIGSDDLRLAVHIVNSGEPAYSTTVTFEIPRGIYLRSILPSCQEEGYPDVLRVTCDVGNPLETTMTNLSLDLDMSDMRNGSVDGTAVNFKAWVKTRGVNQGSSTISVPLHLKANVSVSLSGKAYDNHYYLKPNETSTNITFHHVYQVARFGATPISEAHLTIRIPYKLHESQFLSIVQKPRVFVVDRFYDCSTIGIPVLPLAEESPTKTNIDNDFRLDVIGNRSRSRRAASEDNFASVPRTDTASPMNPADFTQRGGDNYSQPEFYKMSGSDNVDITYLNCSTAGVTCGQVVCKIILLKPTHDVGKLHVQLVVNDSTLAGAAVENENIVQITTEASVEVLDPKTRFIVPGTGIISPVTTTLHHAASVKGVVSTWIILGSVLLGLLVLCLVGFILWKIGFFRRNRKEEMESLKTREDLPMQGAEISNE